MRYIILILLATVFSTSIAQRNIHMNWDVYMDTTIIDSVTFVIELELINNDTVNCYWPYIKRSNLEAINRNNRSFIIEESEDTVLFKRSPVLDVNYFLKRNYLDLNHYGLIDYSYGGGTFPNSDVIIIEPNEKKLLKFDFVYYSDTIIDYKDLKKENVIVRSMLFYDENCLSQLTSCVNCYISDCLDNESCDIYYSIIFNIDYCNNQFVYTFRPNIGCFDPLNLHSFFE